MKQEYRKPQVIKVNLKVEQTVLGGCKTEASLVGPGGPGCEAIGQPCPTVDPFS